MARTWQLQEAKNRLSEVIERARREGPQTVTRRGKEVAVVLSSDQFRELTRPEHNLVEFFARSPLAAVDLKIPRDKTGFREISL